MGRDAGASDKKAMAADRRSGAGRRMHFEALVAVGGESHGPGFEAESVDVSREGMRLRTAYLPGIGDRLLCRFDGETGEIHLEGEVTWRKEEARGGEFGLCFVSLDRTTADAIRTLCTVEEEETAEKADCSVRGARIKLHIEGLGSPMKARVREADRTEVRVGSNLEFLRVGRTLQYEDVDQASKREAYVDHVSVDIDPESGIPQLVVALRFDGVLGTMSPRPATPMRAKAEPKPIPPEAAPELAAAPEPEPEPPPREPTPVTAIPGVEVRPVDAPSASAEGEPSDESARAPETRKASSDDVHASERSEIDDGDADSDGVPAKASADEADASEAKPAADGATEADEEPALPMERSAFRGAGAKAAELTGQAMSRVGPAMSTFGARAQGAMGTMMEIVRKKREARAEAKKAARPRRTTAPPPSGALRSDGRRLIRQEDEELPPPPEQKRPRKAAMIGSAVGLMAVLAVFGLTRGFGPDDAEDAATAQPNAPLALPAQVAQVPQLPPGPGQAMNVDVPLFGATPMSTTEQVLPSEPPAPKAALDEKPASEKDEAADRPSLEQEWGRGSVKHPVVMQIKFDGPIEGITGTDGGSGFTVHVPARKALSSVSQLARKDKRIASVKVVNRGEGAEVSVRFKGDVPPFLVKGKGDRLEIAISGDSKKVASKSSKSSKKRKKGKSGKKR